MLDQAFLEWLRATTEARWADPSVRDAGATSLGELAWQPGTRWRGGMSASDLEIVEAMFNVALPLAYRQFLRSLHTPDPPMAGMQARAGRLVLVEQRLFTDWTGPTTPIIHAFERPILSLLRAVGMGRWHASWGERPVEVGERERAVRRLVAAAPRLIPFAGQRYLAADVGAADGPIIAIHGANAAIVAPDVRGGLLRELGLSDPGNLSPGTTNAGPASGGAAGDTTAPEVRFWSALVGGIPWLPPDEPDRR